MALFSVNCYSTALGECVHFNVVLPQRTTTGQIGIDSKTSEKYPVLYLLHGLSDDESIWLRRTSVERYATEKGLAVVMPTTHRGWYMDSPKGNFFTFIGDELPNLIAEFFPAISTDRKDTFVAGLSMGGYGALKFAFSNPDRYAAAASLSGAFDINAEYRLNMLMSEHTVDGDQTGTDNDVYYLAKKLHESGKQKPNVYMWCGTEDYLLEDNHCMLDLLGELGYNLTYSEYAGNHAWNYWDEQIEKVINWLPIN